MLWLKHATTPPHLPLIQARRQSPSAIEWASLRSAGHSLDTRVVLTDRYCWYNHLSDILHELGYKKSVQDLCLYVKKGKALQPPVLITTYVDDLLVASPSLQQVKSFENLISKRLKVKIMGEVKRILG